jgi:hypothetical protein
VAIGMKISHAHVARASTALRVRKQRWRFEESQITTRTVLNRKKPNTIASKRQKSVMPVQLDCAEQ